MLGFYETSEPSRCFTDGWDYGSKRQNRYSNYIYQQNYTVANYENTESKIDKKTKEKVQDLLLSQPIKGELYIGSNTHYWRKVILKWINESQSGDTLVVSLQKIIGFMKSSGVSFNQNVKLVRYPIKDFLEFYVKTIKTELKKKIQLSIQE